ncbi:MAG: 2-C-methyl-D-erythritol 4-phosphate cytidylyltransferase [Rhodoferax sp.]|nr:2-C-methyl-D-erythritol 4-phosphate cytidylyltransferase [Rhodoferax sp.]
MTTPPATPFPNPRIWALIPCAGSGARAGTDGPKQYQLVAGQPMVLHTLAAFAAVPRLAGTLVVVSTDDTFLQDMDASLLVAACGGATRAASVFNGLNALLGHGAAASDWVLVHDAARCLITPAQINHLIDACMGDAVGGLLALPLPDTLKSEVAGRVADTIARSDKWLAQTPQMFRIHALKAALQAAGERVTDESSAMELAGFAPLLVRGSAQNFKVTYPQDFALAQALLLARATNEADKADNKEKRMPLPPLRIGEGWDIHQLVEGRKLMLGGVEIPYDKGLLGHSDADALLHAITDALLGAAGLGDIGRHFPDTDPQFKGADSGVLLAEALRRVRAQGFAIGNLDCTIIAQAPRLAPHISSMQTRIAALLELAPDQVNVKAKTAEKMGPVGMGQAIEARAVVLVLNEADD